MNLLAQAVLLLALPIGTILSGYWLAGYLRAADITERCAAASLAGLATLLWSVTVVNLFQPLAGIWAWLCLWPILLTFALPIARRSLLQDLSALLRSKRSLVGIALSFVFLGFLVWPLLHDPSLIFYDGTSNHDSFFWIASAEYLK